MDDQQEPRNFGWWHQCKKLLCVLIALLGFTMPFAGFFGGVHFADWLTNRFEGYVLKIIVTAIFGGGLGWVMGLAGYLWFAIWMQMEHRLSTEEDDCYG